MSLQDQVLLYISKKKSTNYYDLFRKFNDMDNYEERNKNIMNIIHRFVDDKFIILNKEAGKIPDYCITEAGAKAAKDIIARE